LLAGRTYIISVGLNVSTPSTVQRSIDGGATWATVWDSGLSGVTGSSSASTITDVYTTTVPTKLRVTAGISKLIAGVWLYIEVK
jgi:hypothetical protein